MQRIKIATSAEQIVKNEQSVVTVHRLAFCLCQLHTYAQVIKHANRTVAGRMSITWAISGYHPIRCSGWRADNESGIQPAPVSAWKAKAQNLPITRECRVSSKWICPCRMEIGGNVDFNGVWGISLKATTESLYLKGCKNIPEKASKYIGNARIGT